MKQTIIRVILLPIAMVFLFAWYMILYLDHVYKFVVYGGEMIVYGRGDRKMIADIYGLLKQQTPNFNNNEK
jgi:hypothetical protein